MDFKSTASITVTASISSAEAVLAARDVPAFEAAVLAAARTGAEARQSATGLNLVEGTVTVADDGSLTAKLTYVKPEAVDLADADHSASPVEQQAVQNAAPPAVAPLILQPLGLTPAAT